MSWVRIHKRRGPAGQVAEQHVYLIMSQDTEVQTYWHGLIQAINFYLYRIKKK